MPITAYVPARIFSAPASPVRGLRMGIGMIGMVLLLTACGSSPTRTAGAYRGAMEPDWRSQSDPIGALLRQQTPATQGKTALIPETDAENLADRAMTYLGIRYRWGGDKPESGFDCSGLVGYVAEQSLGLKLPRNTAEIARLGRNVARDELRAGDLVFFNTLGRRFSHVGIYVGDNNFVHAPSAGGVVRVERMDMRYWSKRYNGARRLQPALLATG